MIILIYVAFVLISLIVLLARDKESFYWYESSLAGNITFVVLSPLVFLNLLSGEILNLGNKGIARLVRWVKNRFN